MYKYRIFNETETINRTKGDTLPSLVIQIYDSENDQPIDMTGKNVRLTMTKSGETTEKINNALFSSGGVVTQGLFTYSFLTTDIDSAGDYNAEIDFVDGIGNVQTLQDRFEIKIRDTL